MANELGAANPSLFTARLQDSKGKTLFTATGSTREAAVAAARAAVSVHPKGREIVSGSGVGGSFAMLWEAAGLAHLAGATWIAEIHDLEAA